MSLRRLHSAYDGIDRLSGVENLGSVMWYVRGTENRLLSGVPQRASSNHEHPAQKGCPIKPHEQLFFGPPVKS